MEKVIPRPQPDKDELLVKVLASSVNPVDTKMRANYTHDGVFRILGFDAVGVVVEVGQNVQHFSVGDKVYYAGAQLKPGSNADLQVVHEALVGHAPTSLSDEEIAAMPLTSITAYEILHEALCYDLEENSALGHNFDCEWCWWCWICINSISKVYRDDSYHYSISHRVCYLG